MDDAHTVLEQLRRATIDQSTDDLSRLYAVDAVHEFPFTAPGFPSQLTGRDDIVSWIASAWQAGTFRYERYRTLAAYRTDDPETIIVEQEAIGTSAATGSFTLPNLMVITVRNGQIVRLRDYVNLLAAAAAIGGRAAPPAPIR